MTNATMALAELAEKGADIDVLRQMVQFMAQQLMELDVEGNVRKKHWQTLPSKQPCTSQRFVQSTPS